MNVRNEGSLPVALSFTIMFKGQPLNFLLPCNHEGVLRCLKRDRKVPNSSKNSEQALRTSWRILKDWVESQMAIVEAELAPIQDIFLHCLIINETGETVANRLYNGNGIKLLNP
jgi:hypothetical protein